MSFYRSKELPEWETTRWLNTPEGLTLAGLRGRVVAIYAFQVLCQDCCELALPQARRLSAAFPAADLVVVALHTVFEMHTRMSEQVLAHFLEQSCYAFPVGIDAPGPLWMPKTMERYGLQGTPSLILVDRKGRRRLRKLGHVEDAELWPQIVSLLREKP